MWNNRIFEISSGLYHFFKWKDKALFTVIRKKIVPNALEPLNSIKWNHLRSHCVKNRKRRMLKRIKPSFPLLRCSCIVCLRLNNAVSLRFLDLWKGSFGSFRYYNVQALDKHFFLHPAVMIFEIC